MKVIRNFIYSDPEKIRSISSQLFEGVSEQVTLSKREARERSESQRGPIGSGETLGQIFANDAASTELKFLEDYAYTLLEQRLTQDDLVVHVDSEFGGTSIDKSFVLVTGTARFNDLDKSAHTLAHFNELGEAFWRVTNDSLTPIPGGRVSTDSDVRKGAASAGMSLNKKVAEAASYVIKFGFGDLLEINIHSEKLQFSAPLKRNYLRETEEYLLQKHGRVSQVDFTLMGIVTQRGYLDSSGVGDSVPDVKDADGIKNAMRTLALHLNTFERSFANLAPSEIILDPIAIYSVL